MITATHGLYDCSTWSMKTAMHHMVLLTIYFILPILAHPITQMPSLSSWRLTHQHLFIHTIQPPSITS